MKLCQVRRRSGAEEGSLRLDHEGLKFAKRMSLAVLHSRRRDQGSDVAENIAQRGIHDEPIDGLPEGRKHGEGGDDEDRANERDDRGSPLCNLNLADLTVGEGHDGELDREIQRGASVDGQKEAAARPSTKKTCESCVTVSGRQVQVRSATGSGATIGLQKR